MSDEDVQRAVRTIERHGQQAQVVQALLPSINSLRLLEIRDHANVLQTDRLVSIRYRISASGSNEPVYEGSVSLHKDVYLSLQDVHIQWLVHNFPKLLTPENIRYVAYYKSYHADPDKEFDGQGELIKNISYHVEAHVKRYYDSNGQRLK